MNLINSSHGITLLLKCIAPVFGLMPGQLLKIRLERIKGSSINIKEPEELGGYIISQYINRISDRDYLKRLGMLTDKVRVRDYVVERVGDSILTSSYGHWVDAGNIDFSSLPENCVLKTNNGCGTNIILRAGEPYDEGFIRRKLNQWLHYPYGKLTGQPHYTYIEPLIFAEELIEQSPGTDELPYDYKFFCFDGEPRFILFYSGRKLNTHKMINLAFDTEWNLLENSVRNPQTTPQEAPANLAEMLDVARRLSKGFHFVRVDLYSVGGRTLFGEMTFTPDVYTNFTEVFLADAMKYVK